MRDPSSETANPISPEDAEKLLGELVAIPSPSRQEQEASAYLVNWMGDHGFQSYIDDSGSAVGVKGKGSHEILLLGHIDTFPGTVPLRIVGRKLYGRGSVDAKGPLAAFTVAAAQVDPPEGTRLVVIGATEEEAATSRGARHALTQFQPSACIIGEPSGWDRITLAYKGRLLVDWSWKGSLAHSAGLTPSPAERAVSFWDELKVYTHVVNDGRVGSFNCLTPSLRNLNTTMDGTHGKAEMQLAFRLPPDLSPDDVETQLRNRGEGATLRFYGGENAYIAPKNSNLTRVMLRAIRSHEGRPSFVHKTGTSDMNVVGPVWRCPIIAYGPGDSRLDHTPEENIDLDEFHRAIAVLTAAINDWMMNTK
jgi:LysW-gamma-L-lysine carboxypeptidase